MTKNEQIKDLFNALVELALRISSKENTDEMGLNILPAIVENIVRLRDFVD